MALWKGRDLLKQFRHKKLVFCIDVKKTRLHWLHLEVICISRGAYRGKSKKKMRKKLKECKEKK